MKILIKSPVLPADPDQVGGPEAIDAGIRSLCPGLQALSYVNHIDELRLEFAGNIDLLSLAPIGVAEVVEE